MPTLIPDGSGGKRITAHLPLDLELSTRLDGPVSLLGATVLSLAPFALPICAASGGPHPSALASLFGVRLDFNNNRDGLWWSPWVALRMGIVAQAGASDDCQARLQLAPAFSPRLGADLWMGQAAASFAAGYDHLPTGSALSAQVGLTVRLN